jgi:sulfur-oxidizing protein SoxX
VIRVRADAIDEPLTTLAADAARGREVFAGRDGNCLLCHAVRDAQFRFMGNLAPALDGVGSRLSAGQLRLRIADSLRINSATIMPSYYRVAGLANVAEPFRGKTILTAQQIEDLIVYLSSLR